jgi:hypothetical protein
VGGRHHFLECSCVCAFQHNPNQIQLASLPHFGRGESTQEFSLSLCVLCKKELGNFSFCIDLPIVLPSLPTPQPSPLFTFPIESPYIGPLTPCVWSNCLSPACFPWRGKTTAKSQFKQPKQVCAECWEQPRKRSLSSK